MTSNTSPTALNKLLENRARLNFPVNEDLTFNLMSFILPGLTLGAAQQATPWTDRHLPGTKMEYERLKVAFHVDEELKTWNFIHNWMRGLATPVNFDEYKNKPNGLETGYITILSSKNNPLYRIEVIEMWPTSLSQLSFSFTVDDAIAMSADAEFSILRYDIKPYS